VSSAAAYRWSSAEARQRPQPARRGAVTDGNGHLYVDIEDKDNVAVVDAKKLPVTVEETGKRTS
jgi:hypothetical protein